MLKNVGPITIR